MKKLRSQHYMLLALAMLALIASIGAYVFMYHDAVAQAEKAALAKADASASADQMLAEKKTETIYQDTLSTSALLPTFLVTEDNAVAFIDAVDAIGPATGATVTISSLSSGTDSSSHAAVTSAISITGSWSSVMRAVGLVENLPYALSVKNLSMNASADPSSKSGTKWSAQMSVSVLSSP